MMMLKYLPLLLLPAAAFASGGGSGEYDILPRAINFAIFAGILYYLIAEPAKTFYNDRLNGIAERLESIQQKLKESKAKKEEAVNKVEEAKANAKALVQTAQREAEILSEKLAADLRVELENLDKSHNESVEIERRRMTRSVVTEVLDEMFESDAISIERDELCVDASRPFRFLVAADHDRTPGNARRH